MKIFRNTFELYVSNLTTDSRILHSKRLSFLWKHFWHEELIQYRATVAGDFGNLKTGNIHRDFHLAFGLYPVKHMPWWEQNWKLSKACVVRRTRLLICIRCIKTQHSQQEQKNVDLTIKTTFLQTTPTLVRRRKMVEMQIDWCYFHDAETAFRS